MQNDPDAPGVLPSRGFASILTLVSDVSKDLEAVEQASAAPPPEASRPPQPVRIGPAPDTAPFFGSVAPESSGSDEGTPAWVYIVGGIGLVLMIRCLGG
ncbi:hypothetical protein [Hyalangium sp.]|uniref:hypothetical protein n=1 Tax=Hyalangium sp. TaxID=2028555 RepID=UPI002D4C37F7|nr:hypothetical protein [Hyalangium sp.]HYI01810.1 hypothetical protein [Hyalangium sp.]